MRKVVILLFSIISLLVLLPINAPAITAGNPPFESIELFNYNEGVSPAPGWYQENSVYDSYNGSTIVGDVSNSDGTLAKWTVTNGHYQLHITPHSQLTFVRSFPLNWPSGLNNYEIEYDMYTLNGINLDRNFSFRHIDQNSHYEVHTYGNMIYLDKAGFDTENHKNLGKTLDSSTYNFSDNTLYHFKIIANENNIKVYIDNETTPTLETTDSTNPYLYGIAGFQAGSGPDAPGDVWFDNIIITPITGADSSPTAIPIPTTTPTPATTPNATPAPILTLSVPDIKQFSTPWAYETYDSAQSWTQNPTIRGWGCALASAVMVLKYYNHKTDPGNLNLWLKDQVDGYIGSGLVNWLAITRFSKQNTIKLDTSKDLPILEFIRVNNASKADVQDVLATLVPPILKIPGHFVVGIGKTEADILVNDPASYTRTKLKEVESAYSTPFTQMNMFIPSHTDLSYLMLTSNPKLNFTLLDSKGKQVGEISIEEPVIEDSENSPIGRVNRESINIYLVAKPQTDQYTIKTTGGNGKFTIDYFSYDKNGELIGGAISKIDIVTSDNLTNSYLIKYNREPQAKALTITFNSTINDLDVLYNLGWIKSEYIYRSLKSKLSLIKFLAKNPRLYRLVLIALKIEIESSKRAFFTNEAYQILLRDINYLISH